MSWLHARNPLDHASKNMLPKEPRGRFHVGTIPLSAYPSQPYQANMSILPVCSRHTAVQRPAPFVLFNPPPPASHHHQRSHLGLRRGPHWLPVLSCLRGVKACHRGFNPIYARCCICFLQMKPSNTERNRQIAASPPSLGFASQPKSHQQGGGQVSGNNIHGGITFMHHITPKNPTT